VFFNYWFLFPIGVLIAFLVMSVGISGAALWVPVFLVWLHLDVAVSFWLGLVTMLFGFGSGVYRNWRDGTFDGPLVLRYSSFAVPAALAGGWIAPMLNDRLLVGGFAIFALGYALAILIGALRQLEDHAPIDGTAWARALVGGLLTGMISFGVDVMTFPVISREPSAQARGRVVGSLTAIIFLTSLAASLVRLSPALLAEIGRRMPQLLSIVIWAVPAVVIGGQLGPRFARLMPSQRHMRLYFGAVLMFAAALTLMRAFATGR
jgi:uncharacterized membrane protein YfcA